MAVARPWLWVDWYASRKTRESQPHSFPLSLPLSINASLSVFRVCKSVEERGSERDEESTSAMVRRARCAGHKVGGGGKGGRDAEGVRGRRKGGNARCE